ncbi:MAG: hypothetical protein HGA23_05900, partial [Bacteroidales bacterium]|nr:hypothetical protein [Bacteroidales bacterium]
MKAIKFSALFVSLACMMVTNAQVAINNTGSAPAASSMLDVSSTTKGLLIPRMTESNRLAISSPATGLIVYQTDQISGFWVYDGSAWKRLYAGTGSAWDVSGNSGTVPGTHFLGTTDNQAFDIRTNNHLRARITTKGQIETYNTGQSVFLGEGAGDSDDLSNNYNVFIGYDAGRVNSKGENNTAIGT